MSPIIKQRNAETIRMLKKMETEKLNKRVELALASFTRAPKVPAQTQATWYRCQQEAGNE